MEMVNALFALVDAYRTATGLSEARISTLVLKGGRRISEIRLGSDIGIRRLHQAIDWFADHWPDDVPWPPDVPRPSHFPLLAGVAVPPDGACGTNPIG
jgi:hypothetical protein